MPLVKCVSIDAWVPADAEFVLEGHLDGKGWYESEGPYGEYVGYYGHMKTNPVFELTAITMRGDALFQTLTIGGRHLECTDTAQLCALRTEAAVWQALETSVRDPVAVYVTPSCGGMFNARICIRQNYPGEARNAISAVLGSKADVKHVFAVDPDIDISSDKQMDWALATRFQADRDFMPHSGYRAVPPRPVARRQPVGIQGRVRPDISIRLESRNRLPDSGTAQIWRARNCDGARRSRNGPEDVPRPDGGDGAAGMAREVVVELDEVRKTVGVERRDDGRYALAGQA